MKTRIGKIARLPREVREQLNRRLDDGEEGKHLVEWLNTLPEVRAVLAEHFGGRPVSEQNLTEWKQGGYRDWQVRQQALEFLRGLDSDDTAEQHALNGPLTEKLGRWLALRYAAAAQALAAESDPDSAWRRLREFCADIVELRRGDQRAERLRLEREWLLLDQTNADHAREKLFWEWTKRPDIREKLFPNHRGGISKATMEKIERELGLFPTREEEQEEAEAAEPGALILPVDQTQSNPIKPDQTE